VKRPPLGTVLVVAVLVGGTVIGNAFGQDPLPRPAPDSVEVVGATAVCPDLRQLKDVLATRVSVGAAPLPAGRTRAGDKVQALRVSAKGAPEPVPVTAPGQVGVGLGTTTDKDGLVVSSTGVLAAGLEVEQVTRGEQGIDRGLAGLRCDAPRPEAWFVGGATLVGDGSVLVLANVDDTPSTVDVSVFSATGAADNRPGQGITIQPHTRQVINLDTLAPDRNLLAVHVLSRRGRVAAGVRHARADGRVPLGVDWVPQATPPSTRVVVPGIPQGPGIRTVLITNPGTDDTTVTVRATTSDGQFVPTKLDQLDVPAGTTISARVDTVAATSAMGVTVTSEGGPIVAGALVQDRQTGPVREFAYTAGSLPLSGPALMTDLIINRPTESTLILTAFDAKATVVVTPIRVLGTVGALPAPKTVQVPAGRTATLKLSTFYPPGTQAQLALEVRPLPGSGPVYAARYLRERGARGPLTTLLDLQGPAQLVSRPAVVHDPRLGS
jgi:hypothetical protein